MQIGNAGRAADGVVYSDARGVNKCMYSALELTGEPRIEGEK